MKRLTFAMVLVVFLVGFIFAQDNTPRKNPYQYSLIPQRLQPLLNKRLDEFVEVQRQQNWERFFELLMHSRQNPLKYQFTAEQQQCIVELIKENPMTNFTPAKASFSTRNLNVPLNEKTWMIKGDAEFRNGSAETYINAAYFNRNWFFSVPQFYLEKWGESVGKQIDLSADFSGMLKVVNQTNQPVEVFDISVKIRPTSPRMRDYYFKVKNNTNKDIKRFGYKLMERGISSSDPGIKAGEFAEAGGFYGANQLFCEPKEQPVRLIITFVEFTDGTKWESKMRESSIFSSTR